MSCLKISYFYSGGFSDILSKSFEANVVFTISHHPYLKQKFKGYCRYSALLEIKVPCDLLTPW